jgi:hypothetical protein
MTSGDEQVIAAMKERILELLTEIAQHPLCPDNVRDEIQVKLQSLDRGEG